MPTLDHLTVIAPTLADGVAHVRGCLGIEMPYGRQHPDMGTHNHLLKLGEDVYLEVIATDPAAPRPAHARWFGLDDQTTVREAWLSGRRLRGWVARTQRMDAVLARHGHILGHKTELSAGAAPPYFFAIPPGGTLPAAGVAPSLIDRGQRPPPLAAMPDLGARLLRFAIEHPDPAMVQDLYATLEIANPPQVHRGDTVRYRAEIETPGGLKTLY
ncbi:hypothetical protein HNP48_006616 [Acidovorax soli]|uniref:Glyoxalase-like domain-containing protein n=1 Tax=Acidovorax soli TaxID=592050 RepID=A0A7X0PKZ4_9BURK|nr:VOC family protein [Acidovorax soli]MBB6563890.1 hypothetical protein [Acidovorax soli]